MPLDAKWKQTIDAGFTDSLRNSWDATVKTEMTDYDTRLRSTPGFVSPDVKLLIAMLWVESGGPKCPAWNGYVMQIGRFKQDKGWDSLVKRDGATTLVVRSELLKLFVTANKPRLSEPIFNIQAGLAYLYQRMAIADNKKSIRDETDIEEHKHVVVKGDNADKIARQYGTTLDELKGSNPDVDLVHLKLGQELLYHKASKPLRITGWLTFDSETIFKRYNGDGDSSYAEKHRYVVGKLTGK